MSCTKSSNNIADPSDNHIPIIVFVKNIQNFKKQTKQSCSIANYFQQKSLLNNNNIKSDVFRFPSIFKKHKKNQYSSYKQIYFNKSKSIIFQTQKKKDHQYQIQRNYGLNIKNISKLRKKYSLELLNRKNTVMQNQLNQDIFLSNSKNIIKKQAQSQNLHSSQGSFDKKLKNALLNQKIRTKTEEPDKSDKKDVKHVQISSESQQRIKKYRTQKSVQIFNIAQKIEPLKMSQNSSKDVSQNPFSLSLKKKPDQRILKFKRFKPDIKEEIIMKTQPDEQIQLTGWQVESFYNQKLRNLYNSINK